MTPFRMWINLAIVIIVIASCSNVSKLSQQRTTVKGHVYLLSGNHMPSPGKPAPTQGRGISRDLYFYASTRANETAGQSPNFTKINTELKGHIKSDSTGYYEIVLPAGEYSVFIFENGIYFANETNSGGVINPVIVKTNSAVIKNVSLSRRANY